MSSLQWFALEPLDTVFFRGGQPFNSGEGGGVQIEGLFPPSPKVVVGFMRAAMAHAQGWNGQGAWPASITGLGNGADLGPLQFGPLLLHNQQGFLLPLPMHCLPLANRTGEGGTVQLLQPNQTWLTDQGNLQLPESSLPSKYKAKEPSDYWISLETFTQVLKGTPPAWDKLVHKSQLWTTEARLGIQRTNRVTAENALYETRHIRLKQGVGMAVGVQGVPQQGLVSVLAMGGESRMVSIQPLQQGAQWPLPQLLPINGKYHYTVVLLSPVATRDLGNAWCKTGTGLGQLPGTVVSACVGKPLRYGGWNSPAWGNSFGPQAIESYLPAGTVFFMKSDQMPTANLALGSQTAWGFGHVAIGVWGQS